MYLFKDFVRNKISERNRSKKNEASTWRLRQAMTLVIHIVLVETANGEGARGFGGDIAILDCAFCLSRILLGSLMGATVDWTGLVDCYIVAAGLLALLACLLAARLDYDPPAPTPLGSLCCEKSFRDNFKVSQESLTSLESLQSEESMDSLVPSENSTGSLESIGSES